MGDGVVRAAGGFSGRWGGALRAVDRIGVGARRAPGGASLAGYLVLRNDCDVPVTVTGAEAADFAMPMIHRTVEEDGVSKMRHVDASVVRPGGELRFEPGGLHLMLMHPARTLAEGDTVRIGLVLADGRTVEAEFPVRRDAPPAVRS